MKSNIAKLNNTEKVIKINAEEAENLIKLLDIAVKSEGLIVAEAAIYFKRKVEEPFIAK